MLALSGRAGDDRRSPTDGSTFGLVEPDLVVVDRGTEVTKGCRCSGWSCWHASLRARWAGVRCGAGVTDNLCGAGVLPAVDAIAAGMPVAIEKRACWYGDCRCPAETKH